MFSSDAIKELKLKYSGFDFNSAIDELIKWKSELDVTYYDDAVTDSILEGIVDLIIDNCNFNV